MPILPVLADQETKVLRAAIIEYSNEAFDEPNGLAKAMKAVEMTTVTVYNEDGIRMFETKGQQRLTVPVKLAFTGLCDKPSASIYKVPKDHYSTSAFNSDSAKQSKEVQGEQLKLKEVAAVCAFYDLARLRWSNRGHLPKNHPMRSPNFLSF